MSLLAIFKLKIKNSKVLGIHPKYGVVKRKNRYHPAGSCDNFNMMSDYCREQLQSCEDYLIKYCKEKLQAEKEGRSLEPDLSPKSMIIVDIVLSFGCVFMGE